MTGGKLRALALTVIMVTSVMVAGVTITGTAAANHGSGAIVVGDSGGADYESIQAAIDHATSGDTIEVQPGNYDETLRIKTSGISLIAPSGATIAPSSGAGPIVSDNVGSELGRNNWSISGFTIDGSSYGGTNEHVGVTVHGANVSVSNNSIKNVKTGVQTHDTIVGNTIENNEISTVAVGVSVVGNNTLVIGNNITSFTLGGIGVTGNRTGNEILNNNITSSQGNDGIGIAPSGTVSGAVVIERNDFNGDGYPPVVNYANDGGIDMGDVHENNTFELSVYVEGGNSINSSLAGVVSSATNGDIIQVGSGTYDGEVTLSNNVTLDGAGEDLTTIKGGSDVINLHSTGVTIRDVTIDGDGGGTGIDVPLTQDASNFKLLDSTIVDTQFGMYVAGDTIHGDADDNGAFDTVDIINVTVRNTGEKGFYIEKLSNARFENVVIEDVGVPAGPYNNGIDINLKNGTYENIEIVDTVVSNVSMGSPTPDSLSAAIAIKGRDDGNESKPSDYASKPGTLDDVFLYNVTVSDSYNGLRFGEPDVVTSEPTNITVMNSTFVNNERYHVQDTRIGDFSISSSNNTFDGEVVVLNNGTVEPSVPEHPTTVWSNIQDGIDFADDGDDDVVFVRNGTYKPITIDKSVSVVGDENNRPTIDAGGSDGITLAGPDDLGITNLVVRNARYGMYFDHSEADPVDGLLVRNVDLIGNDRGVYAPSTTSTALVHQNLEFRDVVASDNADRGIWFMASVHSVSVEDSVFRRNGGSAIDFGVDPNVAIKYSNNSQVGVINVTAVDNEYGLSAHEVDGLLVNDSTFINNTEVAVNLNGPTGALVENNTIRDSGTGFKLVEENFGFSSFDPVASNVGFVNNTAQRNDVQVNDTTGTLDMRSVAQSNQFDRGVSIGGFEPATIFGTIQGGVDAADPGDTVTAGTGTYPETVNVDKNVTVQGLHDAEGDDAAVLDGRIEVSADGATVREIRVDRGEEFLPGQTTTSGILVTGNDTIVEETVVTVSGDAGASGGSVTIDGIQVWAGGPDVSNVLVRNNTVIGVANDGGTSWPNYGGANGIKIQGSLDGVDVVNNDIQHVWSAGWSYGIVMTPSRNAPFESPQNVTLEENRIANVTTDGDSEDLLGVGIGIDTESGEHGDENTMHADDVTILRNSFNEMDVGVLNKDWGANANATLNYWGAPSGPSGGVTSPNGFVADGAGVAVSENVTFRPFLGQPGGGDAAVSLDQSSLAFGDVRATPDGSSSKTLSVQITSSGDEPLKLDAFGINGPDRGQFEIVAGDTGATLSPLETQTVTVAYTPTARGAVSANLTFATNAPGQGTVTVPLSGTGKAPDLTVTNAEPVQFAADVSGEDTDTQTITIRNDGNAPLSISDASAGSPFSASSPASTVGPGASTTLSVEYDPTSGGIDSGSLTLSTNDSFTPSQQVRLSGTARAASIETSIPTSETIDFGTIAVDSSRSVDVIVTNDGTADLTISDVSAPGSAYSATAGSSTIAPGQSTAVNLTVSPDTTGDHTDTLTVSTNARSVSWSLNATAQARELDVTGSLDFGETPVDSTATADLQINNTGSLPLQVDLASAIAEPQFSLVGAPNQLTVPGGQSRTVTVSFSPTSTGDQSGTLTLETNDAGGIDDQDERTATVDLSGNGTTSSLTVQGDSTLSFDPIAAGATSTDTITLQNDGTAEITSLSASLDGQNASEFAVSGVPDSLSAGSTATVEITYQPADLGDHRATLSVTGSDEGGSTSTSAVLNGTAVPPDADLNRTSLDLGFVAVDGGTSTAAVQISNVDTHGTSLSVTSVDVTGADASAFSIESQPDSSIASGGSSVVVVSYDPTDAGPDSATLQIATDDPNEGTLNVSLSGDGAAPEASLSTSSIDFGDVAYGETATRTLTVTNDGGVPLVVNDLSAGGTDASQVSITGSTPATLVPGATETYTVALTPNQQTPLSASVSVDTNENDVSATIDATPTVSNASPSTADGSTIQFGSVRTGSATQQTLTITNDGDAVLTLGEPSVSGADYAVVNAPQTAFLAPDESITYALSFAPSSAGTSQATLTFDEVSDPDVSSLTYTLNGSGIEAEAEFSDASVSLGQVGVGTTDTATLTIENQGSASFDVTGVSVTGTDSGAFSVSGLAAGDEIGAGGSQSFTVEVAPTIRDSLSATLEVETDATSQPLTSALGATGIGPDIELEQSSLTFGETRLGATADRTIVVNNTGNAPLDVSDLSLSGGETDQFVAVTDSVVVPPKGTAQLEVRFAPGTSSSDVTLAHQAAERTATLTVQSNDTDAAEQSFDVAIAGTGVTPSLTAPKGLQYGTVLVDSTTTRTVTLRNQLAGTASLTVTGASIQGPDADAYELASDPAGTVLRPGQETTVGVELTPTSTGPKYATLKLQTNDTRQDTKVVFLSNRDTIVRVTYGSVTMDYIDPVDGHQPEVDVYRGRPLPAQMDAFQIATTQDADYSVTLEGDDQDFSNAERSDAFDSIRYIKATTSPSFVGGNEFQNATFTFRVTKAELANRDVSRSDVYLYHYDTDSSAYEQLDTEFERETQTEYVYSAETTEFSEFSIGAAQPVLSLSDERVGTTSIAAGESVDVSVDVANTGDAPGEQTVALEVDGTTQSTRTVTVHAGDTETVTFTVTLAQAGTYELGINGSLAGTVDVSESAQTSISGAGGGGPSQPSTPSQPVQVLPPEVPQDLVEDTLTTAIQDSTVSFEGQDSTVQQITFEDAPADGGQVTVTELSDVPDGVEDAGDAGEVVHAVDIAVPSELKDSSATVTMTVPVSTLGGTDPADATIVHRQDGTWDPVDTDVVSVQGGEVTLEGQTDGFSLFGVAVAQQTTPTATQTPAPTETPESQATEPTTATEGPVGEPGGFDLSTVVLLVLGLVILIAAIVITRRRRE